MLGARLVVPRRGRDVARFVGPEIVGISKAGWLASDKTESELHDCEHPDLNRCWER